MGDERNPRVIVIGGGIGGACAGYALHHAGLRVNVYEQATDPKTIYVGSGIHIWNNAMRALNEIGLGEKVRRVSGPDAVVDTLEMYSDKGKRLAAVDFSGVARDTGGDCIGVNRAELLPALIEELPEGVLELGIKCTGFTQDDSGVTAHFEGGRRERGDILVGADGVFSVIREQLRGESPPRYAGYTIWQGITEFPHESAPLRVFPIVYGRGLRFAYYRVNASRLYWFAVANAEEGGKDPPGGRKTLLLQRFKGWPDPIERIIELTQEDVIHRRDLYDRDPDTKWGEGRVTLLGDAAHAMTFDIGQGAGQSIEDALVLRNCLTASSDAVAALREYERRRMPRTKHMQNLSRRVGSAGKWTNPIAVGFRNAMAWAMFKNPIAVKKFEDDLRYQF